MSKINKRKYINHLKERLPTSWNLRFEKIDNFLKYVVRERWYKLKFLGAVNFLKFTLLKRPFLKEEKRILAVADFSVINAIGAYIEFMVRLLCESHMHRIDTVDFAIVYNPEKPVSHHTDILRINKDNFHIHLAELLPLLNINPKLGSVFIFKSQNEFEKFYLKNSGRYIPRPSFLNYVNKKPIGRGNFAFFMRNFYLKYNFLPKLEIPELESLRIKAIMKKYLQNRYMVAVNLRSNPLYDTNRNALPEAWGDFFNYCYKEYPDIVFVILGRKNETLDNLKNLPNIIFAHTFGESILQTLAFINNSLLYIATSCGPASYAILREDIPYIITSFIMPDVSYNYNWWFDQNCLLPWQKKELHKIIWQKETPELLIREFDASMAKLDKKKWLKRLNLESVDESVLEWPYLMQ